MLITINTQEAARGELKIENVYGIGSVTSTAMDQRTVDRVKTEANSGKAESMYYLGLMLMYGDGLTQSESNALRWFRRCAMLGLSECQVALGTMLSEGSGGGVNMKAAEAWFRKAANTKHPQAMWLLARMLYNSNLYLDEARVWFESVVIETNAIEKSESDMFIEARGSSLYQLGVMSEYGIGGLAQDFSKAATLYSQGELLGNDEARYNLALMHAYGRGVSQSYVEAVMLFKKGAQEGQHPPSMLYIAGMFLHGQGVPIDYNQSLYWYQQAAASEDIRVKDIAAEAFAEIQSSVKQAKASASIRQQHYTEL